MKYYKDSQNNVYAFTADGSQDDYINSSMLPITEQEADELSNPPPSASAAIAAKLVTINAASDAEIASVSAGYPSGEVLSWPKQEAEARAWTADNQAVTPLLDSLAAARGISKAELTSRVIAKADLFAQVSGAIIGKRQGLEDQIDAIRVGLTVEELEAPITPAVQALLDAVQW